MSRKAFIQSQGGTCRNWNWSWSFVNHKERFVIFGAWDDFNDGGRALIFAKDWERYGNGRVKPGYGQCVEHIRLIEQQGYELRTYRMWRDPDQNGRYDGISKIKGFELELSRRRLIREGDSWYAVAP